MREIIGHVTTKEKEKIRRLHFRECSLNDLIIAIDDQKIDFSSIDRSQVIKDMESCKDQESAWWNDIREKYNIDPYKHVFIDFSTGDLYIDE